MTVRTEAGFAMADIGRADFRPSAAADAACGMLQRQLGLAFRYQTARMAIARSLSVPSMPSPAPDSTGRSIRGETLFGKDPQEQALWIALVTQHADRSDLTKRDLQDLVAAHWSRGAAGLESAWTSSAGEIEAFVSKLVARRR